MDRLSGAILLVLAVPLASGAALLAIITTAQLTASRPVALLAGTLVLVLVAGSMAAQASGRMRLGRLWRGIVVAGLVGVALLVGSSLAWSLALAPMPTTAPPSDGMAWWQLNDGSRIAYRHHAPDGLAAGPPVIIVHGGPGSPDPWDGLATALAAAGHEVYAYDQVGAGLSSRLHDIEDYTVERHARDLEAMRNMIGAEQVALVGSSWGAQLIAAYLADHPERVARAVVASPAPMWAPAFTDAERLTDGGAADQGAVIPRHPRFILPHILMGIAGPTGAYALFPDDQVDGAFASMVGDLDIWAGCHGRGDGRPSAAATPSETADPPPGFGFWVNAMTSRDARDAADPRDVLRTVSTPVLVLRGECDYLSWEIAREYRDTLSGAVLVPVDDAGHSLDEDRPELVTELIRGFLEGDDLSAAAYTESDSPWA